MALDKSEDERKYLRSLTPAVDPSHRISAAAGFLIGSILLSSIFLLEDFNDRPSWHFAVLTAGGVVFSLLCGHILRRFGRVLLRVLLSWHGWMEEPKSMKTKLWGIMLNLLIGKRNHKTWEFSDVMPRFPVPDLNNSLNKWLEVAQNFVSADEFHETKRAVELFRKTQGPVLQKHLLKRYKTERNWFAEYWLSAAYLSNRSPIPIRSNFAACGMEKNPDEKFSDQIDLAAVCLLSATIEAELTHTARLQVEFVSNLVPFCMEGYRMMYNSARIPAKHMDHLAFHKEAKHIVVIRKGYFFKLEMYQKNSQGKETMLNRREVNKSLHQICRIVEGFGESEYCAGALTALPRDQWAEVRDKLKEKNKDTLKALDSAIVILCIDDHGYAPLSRDSHSLDFMTEMKNYLGGPIKNRWFDKTLQIIVSKEGYGSGFNMEHAIADAPNAMRYADRHLQTFKFEKDSIPSNEPPARDSLATPVRLEWQLRGFESIIDKAQADYNKIWSDYEFHACVYKKYGKGFIKKQRLSPDSYCQVALQLAYFRLHGETPKTYSATLLRLFDLGRTEQVHPTSEFSKRFVLAMDDPEADNQQRLYLLRKAVTYVSKFRAEATLGRSCDRHLLGLYCASVELGMDTADIFKDKAWTKPFELSTSTLPMQFNGIKYRCDWLHHFNSFAPTAPNGYGIPYYNLDENAYQFNVSSWKSSPKTNAGKLANSIMQALDDMQELFSEE